MEGIINLVHPGDNQEVVMRLTLGDTHRYEDTSIFPLGRSETKASFTIQQVVPVTCGRGVVN